MNGTETINMEPEAPRTKVTTEGIVKPTHQEMAAYMADMYAYYLREAQEAVDMAENCPGTMCTVDEHLTDAKHAMAQVARYTPKAAA